jgi:ribosomal protein S18 acetylase RimI-like enzyme
VHHFSCDNRGIGTELARHTFSHAKKLGYTFADAICSNRYTQKLCERLGFEKVNEIIYATYLDPPTNTYLFKNVEEPHKSAISYVKKI